MASLCLWNFPKMFISHEYWFNISEVGGIFFPMLVGIGRKFVVGSPMDKTKLNARKDLTIIGGFGEVCTLTTFWYSFTKAVYKSVSYLFDHKVGSFVAGFLQPIALVAYLIFRKHQLGEPIFESISD
jgi:hypothetical protein